jgi:tetratricopeptide (TPR) repeat protein
MTGATAAPESGESLRGALEACAAALRTNPDDVRALGRAAALAVAAGNVDLAGQLLARVHALDPAAPPAPVALARCLLDAGRPADAVAAVAGRLASDPCDAAARAVVEDALAADPGHTPALRLLGDVERARGDLEAAVGCWDLAARLGGGGERLVEAGRALLQLGRADDALAVSETVLRESGLAPDVRALLRTSLVTWFNTAHGTHFLNVGGGPEFVHPRWTNLEAAAGPGNPTPFRFDPACTFPLPTGSMLLVYSSHCLEHLDDATVARVLAETRRVIRDDGAVVLKLPDFDRALAAWRSREPSFFGDAFWGFHTVAWTWPGRAVPDTLDTRAAMLFCGYWNAAYGPEGVHFAPGRGRRVDGAYHGPPRLAPDDVAALLALPSPHALAAALCDRARAEEPEARFNHQNAWSRDELCGVLAAAGFAVLSFDAERIRRRWAFVPDLESMCAQSLYCVAVPT